jgi:hypothetical protein
VAKKYGGVSTAKLKRIYYAIAVVSLLLLSVIVAVGSFGALYLSGETGTLPTQSSILAQTITNFTIPTPPPMPTPTGQPTQTPIPTPTATPIPTPTPTPTPTSTPTPTPSSTGNSATFGTTTIGGSSTTLYGSIPRATQYTPSSSGTVTDIMLYFTSSGAGGHAQAAIYADSGNVPGALIAKSSSDTVTSNGWHDFSGFNVVITAGTPYWLACETDSGNLLWYYNNGGANYYQGGGGSGYGTFPSPYVRGSFGNYQTSIYAIYTSTN